MTQEETAQPRKTFREAWHNVADCLPEDGVIVETKIHDADGCRNECLLKRIGRLWFFPDGSMYVYYVPTHWRDVQPSEANQI